MRMEADKPNTVARWIRALNHNVEEEDINFERKQVLERLFFVLFLSSSNLCLGSLKNVFIWLCSPFLYIPPVRTPIMQMMTVTLLGYG